MERKQELINRLLEFFVAERPGTECPSSCRERRNLLRALMNIRAPRPVPEQVLALQDELLRLEREEKGVVHTADLPTADQALACPLLCADRIILWRGDITRLDADAIVNAANSFMLGCFVPLHNCIDNVIHSAAGLRLRQACHDMMLEDFPAGDWKEPTGSARATAGFNLPCRYVFHTVGPIINGALTEKDRELLASCYTSCLDLAREKDCRSLAFCCISTGEFHFPAEEAARIAVSTAAGWLDAHPRQEIKVIFDVFTERDNDMYTRCLSGRPA